MNLQELLDLTEQILIFRGGATSGNWAHDGRPGKRGGSGGGGGFNRIGVKDGKAGRGKIKQASRQTRVKNERQKQSEKKVKLDAKKTVNNSRISKLGIKDSDKSLDGKKTFRDIKSTVTKAINVINDALPKMKAAGIDMKKAADDAEGLFRGIIRKGWGGNEVDFYVIRNGKKAITAVTQRHIDDVVKRISNHVKNY